MTHDNWMHRARKALSWVCRLKLCFRQCIVRQCRGDGQLILGGPGQKGAELIVGVSTIRIWGPWVWEALASTGGLSVRGDLLIPAVFPIQVKGGMGDGDNRPIYQGRGACSEQGEVAPSVNTSLLQLLAVATAESGKHHSKWHEKLIWHPN